MEGSDNQDYILSNSWSGYAREYESKYSEVYSLQEWREYILSSEYFTSIVLPSLTSTVPLAKFHSLRNPIHKKLALR